MSDETNKRMADTYEITMATQIGGKEVVFGTDSANADPYLCAFYTANELFGEYSECMVGDDYAQIIKLFGQRVQQQAGKVLAEQERVTVPLTRITAEDCFANDCSQSIEDKVVAIKPEALSPEYRTADHQLVLVTGGHGSHANARGNACFCTNLYSGKPTRWERYDVLGEVKPEKLPDWACKRHEEILRKQAKKSKNPNSRLR
ncbi:MAG: hypothetical protein RSD95_00745 [Clostridia bacterium]